MENPSSWNLLIASLNISGASRDPEIAWSFLVLQGLVKPGAANSASFLTMIRNVADERKRRGNMPGPSFGAHLAPQLGALTLPAARQPDPLGKIARNRWETAVLWRKVPGK